MGAARTCAGRDGGRVSTWTAEQGVAPARPSPGFTEMSLLTSTVQEWKSTGKLLLHTDNSLCSITQIKSLKFHHVPSVTAWQIGISLVLQTVLVLVK